MKKSHIILFSGLFLFSVSLAGCNSDNSLSIASQQIAHGEKTSSSMINQLI